MKNKIAIIIPYFGVLPNYFDLWLKSASCNKEIDFFIYTDSTSEILLNQYQNIIINRMTFVEFKEKIQKLFEFKISLDSPYKLCDYKPTYGKALKNDLKGYDFWGYCDVDLIFGRLNKFIEDDILDRNDRIYNLGHLTLYRNDNKMNNLYKIVHKFNDCFSYKYAYRTSFSTAYDEIGTKYGYGLSTICKRIGIKNYVKLDFADINPDKYMFELAYTNGQCMDYFIYDHGRIYGVYKNQRIEEYAYVHLQKRLMIKDEINEDMYYISPNHFRNLEKDVIKDIKSKDGEKNFKKRLIKRKIQSKITKLRQGAIIHYINKYLEKINIK